MVNKLSSTKTQLPYEYDHYYLDYCKAAKIENNDENLGEVLRGDRIENFVYTVSSCYLLWCYVLAVGDKWDNCLLCLLLVCLEDLLMTKKTI
ncbi:hypothetical protein V6N12_004512 [Hibiscus sabdariffa]|uniref:Uncharacterized protein n=1 Tax=Hibiscus sabdariffa TaxID=183260 RepID=A0ABR2CLP3_9ROSI